MLKILKTTACVILAAGRSKRMGEHKALLRYDSNQNFIEKIISEYRTLGVENIIIVAGEALKNKLDLTGDIQVVVNNHQEYERFYSVKLACDVLGNEIDYCFLQNCDNPFVSNEILEILISEEIDAECIIPEYLDHGGHPVLIKRKIINYIREIDGTSSNLKDVLSKFKTKKIIVNDESILININTFKDYNLYFKI